MKQLEKVIWGVIGAGNVCEVKSVPGMYKTEHSEVKMIMRRTADKAADFAHRHGISQWTTEVDEILNDPDINIIYISTPPDSHCELTLRVAAAGKAVYVEKPMANSYEECVSMIEACKSADVPLFVAYYRRALPGFNKLREIIAAGRIGEIRFVEIEMWRTPRSYDINTEGNWRVLPEISGGGHFHDLAAHQLDYLDSVFGPVVKSFGVTVNQAGMYPADDIVSASMLFESGVVGSGIWCFTTDKASEKETITIVGSEGHLVFNTFGSPMKIQITTADGIETVEVPHPEHIQQPLIQTIVNQLRGVGVCPSTGESGIRTTKVMTEITRKNRQ
ncbi:MAG: oxidoreductase [Bacteroidetes bacterium]|nr:oxidoreductase [Bacteroidota bacterium]